MSPAGDRFGSWSSRTPARALAVVVALGVVLMAWFGLAPHVVRAADTTSPLVVVVSREIGASSISLGDLRRCFLGSTVDLAGVRLIPFNHPPSSGLRQRFDEGVLGMTVAASQRYWIDMRIRGGAPAPRTLGDPALLLKVIAKLPGAISYVEADLAATLPNVRMLAIDGVAPNAPHYPLR